MADPTRCDLASDHPTLAALIHTGQEPNVLLSWVFNHPTRAGLVVPLGHAHHRPRAEADDTAPLGGLDRDFRTVAARRLRPVN